jgi:hypothetical protein
MSDRDNLQNLKEHILKDYPRLDKSSHFTFRCHPGVPCFNECCGDINIFLTPYDIVRLKQHLGITSTEFLARYTISPFDKNLKYPVLLLQMNDDENKSCPFVSKQGCEVYENRPWACRMYPLGLAQPGETSAELDSEFYFLLKESMCKGHLEDHDQTVGEWVEDQGIEQYNQMGEDFKNLTTHEFFMEGNDLDPKQIEMFFLAVYDVDRFRKFVFETSFLEKFDIDEQTQTRLREDDLELLKLGMNWLRFSVFKEPTLRIRPEVVKATKEEMQRRAAERARIERVVKQRLYNEDLGDDAIKDK